MKTLAAVAALALTALPAAAQTAIQGQVRPRSEVRHPVAGGPDDFTSMRVRVGLEHQVDSGLTIFVELQDVRTWGEETNTLSDYRADALDLHQGWFRYEGAPWPWMSATIGRMETNLGGQRLVGAVGWTQQGRSFDGVRVDATRAWGNVTALAFKIGDETAPAVVDDHELYGVQATIDHLGPGALEAYVLYDREEGIGDADRYTSGGRYAWMGSFPGRLEANWQTGSAAGSDLSAFMLGARLGTTVADGRLGLALWYDYLSGDDPATPENESFNTLYATNHKFYGFADLFIDVPAHTGGAGLQDLAAKVSWSINEGTTLGVDLHRFTAAQSGSLSTNHFADEVDVTLRRAVSVGLTATAGFSFVRQDDALGEVGRLGENMRWFYVMLDAVF